MHPMVKPALRRTWRDRHTVQFGVDPARAAVLDGVGPATERLLGMLDGTRSLDRLRGEAVRLGVPPERVNRLLALLRAGGVLDDAEAAAALGELPEPVRERLRPDLSSLSVLHPTPGAAVGTLLRRRGLSVQVRGAGRVGASVAAVLAAAGVGRVDIVDSGKVEPWDASPSGTATADVGRQRVAAARTATRRAAADPSHPPKGVDVDLVVFAPRDGLDALAPDPGSVVPLTQTGIAHMFIGVMEQTGFVGPLFVPFAEGGSACAGCLWLHQEESDPAWPRMLAQLRSGRRGPPPACDTALATTVAGLAAMHVLMLLDGGTPPSVNARIELSLADISMGVRRVPRHDRCENRHPGPKAVPTPATASEHGCVSVSEVPATRREGRVTIVPG